MKNKRYIIKEKIHIVSTSPLQVGTDEDSLMLDETTGANLDLIPARGRPAEATLLGVLDNTRTPMGARLLRRWLLRRLSSPGWVFRQARYFFRVLRGLGPAFMFGQLRDIWEEERLLGA